MSKIEKNWRRGHSLISMPLPVNDPRRNNFKTESMFFSWRSTTFRSSMLSSLSWFKTWSIWRWTWSSISTRISATRQIARVMSLISPWTDDQIKNGSKINPICKWIKIHQHFKGYCTSHSVDTTAEMFYGSRINFFSLTGSPLMTLAMYFSNN